MAKKNKSTKDKRANIRRVERRFLAQSSSSTPLVAGIGALTALLLGAGIWGYFYASSFASDDKLAALPQYLIAAGAVLAGITVWIGTSSEPPVRVGSPGIAVEKGEVRRIPWWAVETISYDALGRMVVIKGADEGGTPLDIKLPVKAYTAAVGHVLREGLARIPRRVKIEDSVLDTLPQASDEAGERLDLEPLQVVGKKCAATGKTISYEPDARICTRCERVYISSAVPKKCKCGNSLAHLRPKDATDEGEAGDEEMQDEAPSANVESSEEESARS